VIELKRLRPEDALSFFRAKGLAPADARFDFRDVWRNEHASNFVVAKAMRDEVLETVRGALDRALAQGGTLASFTEELEPELKRLGWWGQGTERDPLTGEIKNVQLGSPRRLRIIFDANMRASHAAGKWARIERVKDAFPFLRYVQVQRDTRRPEHARYHELIRRVDDPVWERIYPPNGWRCGCTVQQLSQAMMDRRGLRVTEDFALQERGVPNRADRAYGARRRSRVGWQPGQGMARSERAARADLGRVDARGGGDRAWLCQPRAPLRDRGRPRASRRVRPGNGRGDRLERRDRKERQAEPDDERPAGARR
jgi:uncharacterized protein with gpF-like domain